MGTQLLLRPKRGHSPQFSAHVCCGQTSGCIKMPLGRPQPKRLCVRWGLSPLPIKGAEPPPQFLAHFYCGQTAGCIKMPVMPLGMKVGLSLGDFVLDGDPPPASPSQKGGRAPSPTFSPCLLWLNGWMDQDDTWHGGGSWSRKHCARWGPSSPPQKRRQSSPIFGRFLLWPNSWMHQDAIWYEGRPQPR